MLITFEYIFVGYSLMFFQGDLSLNPFSFMSFFAVKTASNIQTNKQRENQKSWWYQASTLTIGNLKLKID